MKQIIAECLPRWEPGMFIDACPFCESEAPALIENTGIPPDGIIEFAIKCMICRAEGPLVKRAHEAIDIWNERPKEKAYVAKNMKLENLITHIYEATKPGRNERPSEIAYGSIHGQSEDSGKNTQG